MQNALICFIKFPEPGHVKTRLAAALGAVPAASLYEAMVERVITEVYPLENDYDLFLFYDDSHSVERFRGWLGESWSFRPQAKGDLGVRLEAATRWAFEADYERVAVIGSDCLGMDQVFVEKAFKALRKNDVVLGPSSDGGYYLIGMRAHSPWLFEGIEWSTPTVFETTVDKVEVRDLALKKLEVRIDVDTIEDLIALKQSLPEEHFLHHKIDFLVLNRRALDIADADQLFE